MCEHGASVLHARLKLTVQRTDCRSNMPMLRLHAFFLLMDVVYARHTLTADVCDGLPALTESSCHTSSFGGCGTAEVVLFY